MNSSCKDGRGGRGDKGFKGTINVILSDSPFLDWRYMIHNGVIIDDGEIRVFLDGLTEDYVSVHMYIVQYIS